jgi:hypothetical protein
MHLKKICVDRQTTRESLVREIVSYFINVARPEGSVAQVNKVLLPEDDVSSLSFGEDTNAYIPYSIIFSSCRGLIVFVRLLPVTYELIRQIYKNTETMLGLYELDLIPLEVWRPISK